MSLMVLNPVCTDLLSATSGALPSSAVKRSIRTGASSLNAVEILAGAKEGDRIVVSGADAFGDSEKVRISGE